MEKPLVYWQSKVEKPSIYINPIQLTHLKCHPRLGSTESHSFQQNDKAPRGNHYNFF